MLQRKREVPLERDAVKLELHSLALRYEVRRRQSERLLHMPIAVVNKTRLSGEEVEAKGIVGEVRGRPILFIDDTITTGGTIAAAVNVVQPAGARSEVTVAAIHGLFVGPAQERLCALGVKRFIITDSVAPAADMRLPVEVVSVAPLLAEAIGRSHGD